MSSPASQMQAEELHSSIRILDCKFRRSCQEILLLNNQIEELQVRYDRAMWLNRRSFRYSIRLRLATLEGVRNMFYEYASRCADRLEELQNELIVAGGEPYESGEWEPVTSSDEELPVADHQPLLTTTASSTSNTASSTTSSVTTQLSTSSSAARVVESSSASAHTSESLLLDSVNNNSNENFTLVMSGLPGNNIMFGTIDNSSDDNDGNLNDNVGNIDNNDTSNSIISDVQGDNISSDVNMNINNLEGDNIVVDDLESSNINTSLTRSNNNDSVNINMSNVGNIVAHTGDHDSISVNSLANSHLTAHNNQGNEECGDYVMPGFDRVSDSPAKNIVNSSNILSGSVLSSGS